MKQKDINMENKRPFIKKLLSNPILNGIGVIIGLIGLLTSIYSISLTTNKRELIYSVSPIKALALKTEQVSDLKVFYLDKEINKDITVAQIAIWNRGKLPIKAENILHTIQLSTSPVVPILNVSLRKISREVINFSFDETKYDEGIIPLKWDILEHNDGVVIQVIYLGSENIQFKLNGVVEGQTMLIEQQTYNKIQSPAEQIKSQYFSILFIIIFLLVVIVLISIFGIRTIKKLEKKSHFDRKSFLKGICFPYIFLILILIGMLFYYIFYNNHRPPFGF